MQRERIADDIYVFVSDIYAQVTATVIATPEGAIVFDTLLYPEETRLMRRFIETRLRLPVRYVINSHYHADHTAGTCQFPEAEVIANAACRDLLNTRGRHSLERSRAGSPELREVELRLPDITFETPRFELAFGGKTLEFTLAPGHSRDSMVCLVREDRVLLAADTLLPVPYFVDGDYDDCLQSILELKGGGYENIIQGHGDIILRGEVEAKIASDIDYLHCLCESIDAALKQHNVEAALRQIDVESCGKRRVLLNGLVEQLHWQNVQALAGKRRELLAL